MKSVLTIFFGICIFISTPSFSSQPQKTIINDPEAAKALLGTHKLTHQVISWSHFGAALVTNDNGVFKIKGAHRGGIKKLPNVPQELFEIEGIITEINNTNFKFLGKMTTRFALDNNKTCHKDGLFHFAYRQAKSRSWRLLEEQHTCTDHVIFIDLYVDRPWSPKTQFSTQMTQLKKWGVGLITYKNRTDKQAYKILFPPEGNIALYDTPGETLVAFANINLNNENFMPSNISVEDMQKHDHYAALLIKRNNSVHKENIHLNDIEKVADNVYAVKVYDRKNGHLQILANTLQHEAWVSESDLNKQEFQFTSWPDYLLLNKTAIYVTATNGGLNVRNTADSNSKLIATLKGESYRIALTGVANGPWFEINLKNYDPTCTKILSEGKGWIKAIDDKGFPNIWRQPKACGG